MERVAHNVMDLTGRRHCALTVIGKAPTHRRLNAQGEIKSKSMWFVRCDCGYEHSMPGGNWEKMQNCVKCKYNKISSFEPGDKVGCLDVIARHTHNKNGKRVPTYECKCECGKVIYFNSTGMKSKHRQSCTCNVFQRHGHSSKSPENDEKRRMYNMWNHLKDRLYSPLNKQYRHYGGRGIKMCDRWLVFENFLADVGYKKSPELSLDRIDPDGDYSPENCRWADKWTQSRNRGFNTVYKCFGLEMTLGQWMAHIKINGEKVSVPEIGTSPKSEVNTPTPHPFQNN